MSETTLLRCPSCGALNRVPLEKIKVLKNGREVDRIVGVQPKTEIVRRLQKIGL